MNVETKSEHSYGFLRVEAELYLAVLTAQDMMFVYHVLVGTELQR